MRGWLAAAVGLGLAATAFGLAAGCGRSDPNSIGPSSAAEWFEDATDRLGVRFTHDPGPTADYLMPRAMGSGCGLFDADGDGRLDILLLQNAGPGSGKFNQLFLQQSDGTFRDASAGSGLDFDGHNMGVAVGDVDDDGRPDVLVTQYRGARLLHNRGGGRFADVSAASGLDNPQWGTSATFFDFDRDGRLDLFIANYVDVDPSRNCPDAAGKREFCGPDFFAGTASRLFRNLGPKDGVPRFADVSLPAGVVAPGPGLGVYAADLSGDGWPDVFVANDEKANHLWVNGRDGTFKNEAVTRGLAFDGMGKAGANMGIAVGDSDGDGLTDLFVTHLTTETHTLWKQGPPGTFSDKTLPAGVVRTGWRGTGFGTVMADFDRDGRPDLALVNGRISRGPTEAPHLSAFWRAYGERNQLLRNVGGKFEDVSEANPALCGTPNVARGLACGDLDGDGRPDLVVTTVAAPARVLLNRSGGGRHWLGVRAVVPTGRDAYGAEVRVRANGAVQVQVVQPATSYLCSGSPEALVGLNEHGSFDGVEVRWPDGSREEFPGGPADRRVTLTQGTGAKR